jgi:HSP20 family protein
VDITLEDDVLTIAGRQEADAPAGLELLHRGYETGVFRRSFTLGAEVDRAGINARLAGGVLEIMLPKAEKVRPRKIAVQGGA